MSQISNSQSLPKHKYILEMTEEQARTICSALEFTARMEIGQWNELLDRCFTFDRSL